MRLLRALAGNGRLRSWRVAACTSEAKPSAVRCSFRRHRPNDTGEGEELSLLRLRRGCVSKNGTTFVRGLPYGERRTPVRCRRSLDGSHGSDRSRGAGDEVEDLSPFDVLTDAELGNQLRPALVRSCVPTDRYVKRTFSIDETRDVRIQPFLLIVRTGWIFTAHVPNPTIEGETLDEYHQILGVSSI